MQKSILRVVAPAIPLLALAPASVHAASDSRMIQTLELSNGQVIEMSMRSFTGIENCWRELKKLEIGSVIPAGRLIDANGNSYAATVISGRCERKAAPMMGR